MIRDYEFFTSPNGDVFIEQEDGSVILLKEEGGANRAFIEEMMDRLATYYPEAFNRLKDIYGRYANNRWHHEFLIVHRFIRCNFSAYDYQTMDIDECGRFRFEEVRCPIRCECPHKGVICKPRFNSCLSYREKEVLALVAKHLNKEEIGDALHISPYTVANHIRHIYEKTGKHSEAELVEYWLYFNP